MLESFLTIAQAAAQTVAPAAAPVAETAAKQQPQGWESYMSLIPMIVIVVAMFYLMYRGQKKEQAKREAMINSVKTGVKVLTVGGMKGVITQVKDSSFELEIARNVRVEISKNAIAGVEGEDVKDGESVKK